jgi:nitroreductase
MKPSPISDYPLHPLIAMRWSPRSFAPTPLSEKTFLTLLEAARFAASMNNFQPWRFIYATRDQPDRFCNLVECLKPGNRVWAGSAPLLMLTLIKVNLDNTDKPNLWAKYDLGLAMGNLTAQASSMDLYVHNMAGFDADSAKKIFSIPDEFQPVTMVAIGYLGDPGALPEPLNARELAPQKRKPLSELILNDKFQTA